MDSSTPTTFMYLTYEELVTLVAFTVKWSLFSVNGKSASRVTFTFYFKTGETDDGLSMLDFFKLFFIVIS